MWLHEIFTQQLTDEKVLYAVHGAMCVVLYL